MGARVEEYWDTIWDPIALVRNHRLGYKRLTFEFREVVAARRRAVLSSRLIGVESSVRYSTAFADALWKDSAMIVG